MSIDELCCLCQSESAFDSVLLCFAYIYISIAVQLRKVWIIIVYDMVLVYTYDVDTFGYFDMH